MTSAAHVAPAPELVARLHRFASLVLQPHGNSKHVVEEILERDRRELDRHLWDGQVTRDEWLFTLAVRRCRDILSGHMPSEVWKRARAAEHRWDAPRRPIDVDAIRAGTTTSDLLDQALTALTDPDRIAVVLCDALGMSVAECGRICRTPDPITRMHLSRGRKTLLAVLGATEPIAFATDEAEQVHDLVFAATTQDDAAAIAQHCDDCVCCSSAQEGLTVLRAKMQQHRLSVDAR